MVTLSMLSSSSNSSFRIDSLVLIIAKESSTKISTEVIKFRLVGKSISYIYLIEHDNLIQINPFCLIFH
jgi:hypothetical protein